ncbi:MAG: M3 family oligoendopeptidase, partial [Clostridia bacterium]|nr:M3 family oligoendopeptidase [Clostridia bacterium]
YSRYEVERAKNAFEAAIKGIKDAKSASEVLAIRKELLNEMEDLSTASALSYMRWSCDTKNEFYKGEKEYYEQNMPLLAGVQIEYTQAMMNTPFRAEVEAILPAPVYKNFEVTLKSLDEKIVPEMQEESAVCNEYSQFMSELVIEFRGETMPLTILRKYMSDGDRETRREAHEALGKKLEEHAEFLDDVYDRLVKIRDRMAKKMGYKNYVELGYHRMGRICYDRTLVEQFRKNILEDIVPVVTKVRTARAKQMGIDEMKLYDYGVCFANGDPDPILNDKQMFEAGREMYHEMSKETGDFIDMMIENDAFDVLSREGKWGGGYCTEFAKYKQPFILANFNGTSGDVDVLTHEAGHAFASYLCFLNDLDPEASYGMETAETHSMSMECLCWKFMDKFFGDRTKDYKFKHLFDNISFLTYGIIVDAFQHIVYENPDLTPAERNAEWKKLEQTFRPYMNADGMTYFEKGTRWQYQMHIYESPFYYIDYCLAQSNALQFLFKSLENYQEAFDAYFKFTSYGGTKYFTDMLEEVGINSPFKAGALKEVAVKAERLLEELSK